jgi:hypothetical protein
MNMNGMNVYWWQSYEENAVVTNFSIKKEMFTIGKHLFYNP